MHLMYKIMNRNEERNIVEEIRRTGEVGKSKRPKPGEGLKFEGLSIPDEKSGEESKDENKSDTEDKYESGDCQWVIGNGVFYSIGRTVKNLPSGYYTYAWNQTTNKIMYSKIKVITDNILKLPDITFTNLLYDFQKFWGKKHFYTKYEFIYK